VSYTPQMKVVPLEEWPIADQERWTDAVQAADLLDTPGPLAHFPNDQLLRKRSAYGRWLGFAVGTDIPKTSGLDYLTPHNLRTFIAELKTLFAPYTVAGYVTDLEIVVRAFRLDGLDFLHTAATTLRRMGRPAGNKRSRLRPSAELYQLGLELMRGAASQVTPQEAARTFQDGLTIALLAARPVRLKNLASIEVGHHLTKQGDLYWLTFTARETKTYRHLEFPLPCELTALMDQHLTIYRPILLENLGKWGSAPHSGLWVSMHGSKMNQDVLYRHIYERTKERFGEPVNPHLFRDAAATSIAIEDPDHVGIITAILGHSNTKTAETYYNQATSLEAARRHQAVIQHFKQAGTRGT